jgi:hypothetical protein
MVAQSSGICAGAVYVVLKAPNDYAAACFKQYGLPTDSTGHYAAMYKPFHLIGLELSISVLSAALRVSRPGRAVNGAATWQRWQSATSRLARCSMAKAATRFTATSCLRFAAGPGACSPSAWPMVFASHATFLPERL